jgi:hypothetical protein
MNFPYMMEIGRIIGESYRSPYRLHASILSKGRKLYRCIGSALFYHTSLKLFAPQTGNGEIP